MTWRANCESCAPGDENYARIPPIARPPTSLLPPTLDLERRLHPSPSPPSSVTDRRPPQPSGAPPPLRRLSPPPAPHLFLVPHLSSRVSPVRSTRSRSRERRADERSSTNDDDDAGAVDGGCTRRTFIHSYKMAHCKPLNFTWFQVGVLSYRRGATVDSPLHPVLENPPLHRNREAARRPPHLTTSLGGGAMRTGLRALREQGSAWSERHIQAPSIFEAETVPCRPLKS